MSYKQHLRRLEAAVHDHQKGMIWVFYFHGMYKKDIQKYYSKIIL